MALKLLDKIIDSLEADIFRNGQKVVVQGLEPKFDGMEGFVLWKLKESTDRYFVALQMEENCEYLVHVSGKYLSCISQNMRCIESRKIADVSSFTICTFRMRATATYLMIIPYEVVMKWTIHAHLNSRRTKGLWRNTATDLDQLSKLVTRHEQAFGYIATD